MLKSKTKPLFFNKIVLKNDFYQQYLQK